MDAPKSRDDKDDVNRAKFDKAPAPEKSTHSAHNPWWGNSWKDKPLSRPSSDQPRQPLEKEKNPWWSLRISDSVCQNLPQRPLSDQPRSVRPSWREVCARAQKPDGSVRASPPVVWQRKSSKPPSASEDNRRWRGLAMPEPLRQLPLQVLEASGYEDENDGPLVNVSSVVHYLQSVVAQIDTNISHGNIPSNEKLYAFQDRLIRTLRKWIKRNVPREHKVQMARVLLTDISTRSQDENLRQDSPENLRIVILSTISKLNMQNVSSIPAGSLNSTGVCVQEGMPSRKIEI